MDEFPDIEARGRTLDRFRPLIIMVLDEVDDEEAVFL